MSDFLKLREAYVSGMRRKFSMKLKPRRGTASPWVHPVGPQCRIYRVATDHIVVTDGGSGYMGFQLSTLQELLRESRDLPIVDEVSV